jgi:hypothetical protein
MGVRKTESRMPEGFEAQDFGQAAVKDGNYALVSYFTSPIALSTTITYIVFVLNNATADTYHWTFESIPSGKIDESVPDPFDGLYRYTPKHLGTLKVKVEVTANGEKKSVLELEQEIVPLDSDLESLLAGKGSIQNFNVSISVGALGGNDRISREIVNNFRNYILDTAYNFKNYILPSSSPSSETSKIPPRFLAAIAYLAILRSEIKLFHREAVLEKAANELNEDNPISFLFDPLGVCQIKPQVLAMAIRKPNITPEKTYTDWIEIPADGSKVRLTQTKIKSNFDNLELNDKIDLFNLLRFPKSNIRMCEQLLFKLNDRKLSDGTPHRWGNLTREELLENKTALEIIATEFFDGSTLAPKPTDPASDKQLKSTPIGRKVASIINTPFLSSLLYGTHELKGKVKDSSGNGIENAILRLYRTMVRISNDDYKVYDQNSTGSNLKKELPNGDYPVLEIMLNHPTSDTDYVKIKFGRSEGWICSKWKESTGIKHGAFIFDERLLRPEKKTSSDGSFKFLVNMEQRYRIRSIKKDYFDGESSRVIPDGGNIEIKMESALNSVNEKKIIKLLKEFKDYKYGGNYYPYELPGSRIRPKYIKGHADYKKENNCCSFTEALLVKAWLDNIVGLAYDLPKHNKWINVGLSKDTRMDVLDPLIDLGIGIDLAQKEKDNEKSPNEKPVPWTMIQGYRYKPSDDIGNPEDPPAKQWKKWQRGHSFIILDYHPETDRVLTLESNSGYNMNGPGFRKLGDLDDDSDWVKGRSPARNWWEKEDLQKWDEMTKSPNYPYWRMVRLKVYDLKWVK